MLLMIMTIIATIGLTVLLDPYFYYHKPLPQLQYVLDNERSQNLGIIKNFEYDGMIIGTSMTENFKTSEANELFDMKFIKVPYQGGQFKEINDNVRLAVDSNPNLRCVIRCLDQYMINVDKDVQRVGEEEYPAYLYDMNLFNDLNYVLNKGILFSYCADMLLHYTKGESGKITSFDEYKNWNDNFPFGAKAVLGDDVTFEVSLTENSLTEQERKQILENIRQNVTSIPAEEKEVVFYYFFPPYSAKYWAELKKTGDFEKHLQVLEIAMEEILKYPNVRLYSFDYKTEITTNLDYYMDPIHYHEDVNTWMLQEMKEGRGLLTVENYKRRIDEIRRFYGTYDFMELLEE